MLESSPFFRDRSSVTSVMSDPLSDVLDLVETQGVMSSAIAADGAWYARGSVVEHPLKFVAVARGSVRLTTDDGNGPLTLGPGEVAILNNGHGWRSEEETTPSPRARST